MKNNHAHFNNICEIEPPAYLKGAVLNCIALAREVKVKRQKRLLTLGFVATGISFIAAVVVLGSQLMASDFWSIVALSYTDAGTLLGHWQEYGISLLETFPAMSVAGILLPVFLFMLLLKEYAREQYVGRLKFKSI